MSLPKPDLHIRLNEDAKSRLDLMAQVSDVPSSTLASSILERAIMGEAHALIMAAKKVMREGIAGIDRSEGDRALAQMRDILGMRRG